LALGETCVKSHVQSHMPYRHQEKLTGCGLVAGELPGTCLSGLLSDHWVLSSTKHLLCAGLYARSGTQQGVPAPTPHTKLALCVCVCIGIQKSITNENFS
jgi:hypothetical protein